MVADSCKIILGLIKLHSSYIKTLNCKRKYYYNYLKT